MNVFLKHLQPQNVAKLPNGLLFKYFCDIFFYLTSNLVGLHLLFTSFFQINAIRLTSIGSTLKG